jgi:hypothetical protein
MQCGICRNKVWQTEQRQTATVMVADAPMCSLAVAVKSLLEVIARREYRNPYGHRLRAAYALRCMQSLLFPLSLGTYRMCRRLCSRHQTRCRSMVDNQGRASSGWQRACRHSAFVRILIAAKQTLPAVVSRQCADCRTSLFGSALHYIQDACRL